MPEMLQHVIVTLVAFGAAGVVFRRVFTIVKPARGGESACASCPSATKHAATVQPAPALGVEARPLTFVSSRSSR